MPPHANGKPDDWGSVADPVQQVDWMRWCCCARLFDRVVTLFEVFGFNWRRVRFRALIEMKHGFDASVFSIGKKPIGIDRIGCLKMVRDAPGQVQFAGCGLVAGCGFRGQQIHVVSCWATACSIGEIFIVSVGRRERKMGCAVASDNR